MQNDRSRGRRHIAGASTVLCATSRLASRPAGIVKQISPTSRNPLFDSA
jgi:hypothetical protein